MTVSHVGSRKRGYGEVKGSGPDLSAREKVDKVIEKTFDQRVAHCLTQRATHLAEQPFPGDLSNLVLSFLPPPFEGKIVCTISSSGEDIVCTLLGLHGRSFEHRSLFAIGYKSGKIAVYNANNPHLQPLMLDGRQGLSELLALMEGPGKTIISTHSDQRMVVWSLRTNVEPVVFRTCDEIDQRSSMATLDNGKFATLNPYGAITIWDPTASSSQTSQTSQTIVLGQSDDYGVMNMVPLKGGKIVTCCCDEAIRIWDTDKSSDQKPLVLKTKKSKLRFARVCSNGKICGLYRDDQIRVWDPQRGSTQEPLLVKLRGNPDILTFIEVGNRSVAAICRDDVVRVWAHHNFASQASQQHSISVGENEWKMGIPLSLMAISGDRFVCKYGDNCVKVWDVNNLYAGPAGRLGQVKYTSSNSMGDAFATVKNGNMVVASDSYTVNLFA